MGKCRHNWNKQCSSHFAVAAVMAHSKIHISYALSLYGSKLSKIFWIELNILVMALMGQNQSHYFIEVAQGGARFIG